MGALAGRLSEPDQNNEHMAGTKQEGLWDCGRWAWKRRACGRWRLRSTR